MMGDLIEGSKFESLFVKSIQAKGYQPIIVNARGSFANFIYRVIGVSRCLFYEDFIDKARQQNQTETIACELFENCVDLQSLLAIHYRGVNVGKYACSTVLRQTHSGEVDFSSRDFLKIVKQYVQAAIENVLAAELIYELVNPAKTLFLERGYSPYGEFFDISVNRGIDTIQWIGCHTPKAVILKRYNRNNTGFHPSSLSNKSWDCIKDLPWNESLGNAVKNELYNTYASGEWFNEVGTQFNTRMTDRQSLYRQLELDPGKKVGIIFSHILWDATFFYGEDLFADYKDWLIETVKAAMANTHMNWVIKIHPANVIKKYRENYRGQWAEFEAVESALGKLPEHIKWLLPDTSISTYSLFEFMDYCITVRGTIGLEAALFGVPVLTAGTGRYDNHGFTIDSTSRESYLGKIANLHEIPPLTEKQKQLAQKFAHGIFCLRPFPLRSITVNYAKDSTATMKVTYNVRNMGEWAASTDFNYFGDWVVNSQDEDFLSPDLLKAVCQN
ncbi:MAG: hypothetical protein ABIL58_14485 [Pseudomonadota bacterium]